MKKLALALLASAALALPAVAQQLPAGPSQNGMNAQQLGGISSSQQGTISPRRLSKNQIRRMQLSLNRKGFHSGRADGIWGPHTRSAVTKFQKSKGIQANGALDQQTLSELGVNVAQANPPAQRMRTGRSVYKSRHTRKSRMKHLGTHGMKSGRSVSAPAPKTKARKPNPSGSSSQYNMNKTNSNGSNGY